MNKDNQAGQNYQHKMDIRVERIFRKRFYSRKNQVNVIINHINKELDGVWMVPIFIKFFLIKFLCEYVLFHVQSILMNKIKKHLIVDNKFYIILLPSDFF